MGFSTKPLPRALSGFDNISRAWDPGVDKPVARILPGEFYVTPHDEMITTVLGSCVSACIRDPSVGVGGMNHFLLPLPDKGEVAMDPGAATRYGSFAMERLINEILKCGGKRQNLEVKVTGGGRMYEGSHDVGRQNLEFVARFLREEGLKVVGKDIGQTFPRNVRYFPRTGKVQVRKLRPLAAQKVKAQETQYATSLRKTNIAGSIDLF